MPLSLPLALTIILSAVVAGAQPPAGRAGTGRGRGGGAGVGTPGNAAPSPEVHPDRTVTFRLRAPLATEVQLVGEILQGKSPQAMTKDATGVWTATVGSLPPGIWVYSFRVQGVDMPDPGNPAVKAGPPGHPAASLVEVPGDSPSFYDSRPVPHGEVRMVRYESKAFGLTRPVWIYTPPNYEKSTAKYPALYLLHGYGESVDGWVVIGRANVILDNLIADKKAQPMIVVMPQGHALQAAGVEPLVRITDEKTMFSPRFPADLLGDVLPLVERNYRVIADADHRAIAGLSMGGGQALSIGLAHPELFRYVLGYSAAVGDGWLNIDDTIRKLVAKPTAANATFRLLWISVGRQDPLVLSQDLQLEKTLADAGIKHIFRQTEGSHVWSVWRNSLNESLPLIFKAGGR